jgi:DNA-binding response OmpR family regulator
MMSEFKREHKILIVDDDPMNLEIIEEILGDLYILKCAQSGEEAILEAYKFKPDLILLDIMMSGMDGYEVCRQIKNNNKLSLTKIILVSAKQMLEDRLEGYASGADDYISKPFDPEELRAKIKVFLRLKSVEEVERTKSDLISIFSHETRTPLHTVIGFATLLKANQSLKPEDYEAIDYIIDSSRHLLDLIDKTILLVNLRSRKNIYLGETDILSCLYEVVEKSGKEHPNIEITLNNNSGRNPVLVAGDYELLMTAFLSLIAAFMGNGKSTAVIDVDIEQQENQPEIIRMKFFLQGISVSDAKSAELFKAYQTDDVLHHGTGGYGVVLALLRQIIELHNGSVEMFFPSEEQSVRFMVKIPYCTI